MDEMLHNPDFKLNVELTDHCNSDLNLLACLAPVNSPGIIEVDPPVIVLSDYTEHKIGLPMSLDNPVEDEIKEEVKNQLLANNVPPGTWKWCRVYFTYQGAAPEEKPAPLKLVK